MAAHRARIDPEELRRLVGEGWTQDRLAAYFGVAETTVRRWRAELGISSTRRSRLSSADRRRISSALSDGWSHSEISRTLGVDPGTLRANFPGTAWTDAQRYDYLAARRRFPRVA